MKTKKRNMDNDIIIAKNILTDEKCDELLDLYKRSDKSDVDTLGCRTYVKIATPEFIIDEITKLLGNYILIKKIETECVIYHTIGGSVKEHTDRIFYDETLKCYSKYTLIIYLSNTEEDSGMTRIKRLKKYEFENDDPEMKHERHWIKPIKGGCVLFNSLLYHDATESYGDKYIMTLKIY